MNLSDDVTIASIAKVREDKTLMNNTDTSELLTEEEEAQSAAAAAEAAKKVTGQADVSETDEELMKELLERAEADSEEE